MNLSPVSTSLSAGFCRIHHLHAHVTTRHNRPLPVRSRLGSQRASSWTLSSLRTRGSVLVICWAFGLSVWGDERLTRGRPGEHFFCFSHINDGCMSWLIACTYSYQARYPERLLITSVDKTLKLVDPQTGDVGVGWLALVKHKKKDSLG